MGYTDSNTRMAAVETRDIEASNAFVYGDQQTGIFCRPDCGITSIPPRNSMALFDTTRDAKHAGMKPCTDCKPDFDMKIDKDAIDSTVSVVNASLGLELPSTMALDQSDTIATGHMSSGMARSATATDYGFLASSAGHDWHQRSSSLANSNHSSGGLPNDIEQQGWKPRRASIASGHIPMASAAVAEYSRAQQQHHSAKHPAFNHLNNHNNNTMRKREHSKSENSGDHLRLVDEACRSIALRALQVSYECAQENAESEAAASTSASSASRRSSSTGKGVKLQRKKRRGGILGFKELASKAGLSPWHFHRVFRSVVGCTPKVYGEKCFTAATTSLKSAPLTATAKPVEGNKLQVPMTTQPSSSSSPSSRPLPELQQYDIAQDQVSLPQQRARGQNSEGQFVFPEHQTQQQFQAQDQNQMPVTSATDASLFLSTSHPMSTTGTNESPCIVPTTLSTMANIHTSMPMSTSAQDTSLGQTWAPNDDMDTMTTTSQDFPSMTVGLTMEDDPAVTTAALNDLFVTTAGMNSATMAPTLTESLDIGGLTSMADDNRNNWLIETPSAVSEDPVAKDPFFQSLATNGMPQLASSSTDWVDSTNPTGL